MSKMIVLTGATRGLGRAWVDRFDESGCVVAGCGRTSEHIEAMREALDPRHDFSVVDVGDDASVKAWSDRVLDRFGPPDVLINNAALINRNAPLWKVPVAEFDAVIDVNIKGVANVIRHFAPAMVAVGRGVIVNLSSGWGRSTSPEVAPYCATKWAIEGLTRALAQELPSGMAAVPLNPGIIDTEMLRSCFGGGASGYPSAEQWSRRAVELILEIGPAQNGTPMSVK